MKPEPSPAEDVTRAPDQVRKMMSSYQTGTRRGRSDAARLAPDTTDQTGSDATPPPPADA